MPGTYSQMYIHCVFAVKNRNCLVQLTWEEELYKYISGIVQNKGQKLLAVNGMPDHIHLFLGIKPTCCISDLIREIKKSSSAFANNKRFSKFKFCWQEGYGAFSHSHSEIDSVVKYIINQKIHHQKTTFEEEYIQFLKNHEIEFQSKYLFEWIMD
jgi:putative transposase